jgi:hypothetical protein
MLQIPIQTLTTYEKAEQSLLQAMRWLKNNTTLSAAVIQHVKSTVCVTFSYNTAWPKLTPSATIRATAKSIRRNKPVVRRALELHLDYRKLWQHYRQLPPLHQLSWATLVGKTITLLRAFGRLRFSELETLDAEANEPNDNGWNFVTRIKLQPDPEVIVVPRLREQALDPVQHLLQLRERIRKRKEEIECMQETGFWMKEDGKKMSYGMIRKACCESLKEAGIEDWKHLHHLKAAAITKQRRRGMQPEEIVAYARHKPGSHTWETRYLDTRDSMRRSAKLLAGMK